MAVSQIINVANVLIPTFIKADSSNLPPLARITDMSRFSKEGRNEKMQRAMSESYLEIVYAYCLDCKASEGGCKHAVAFVYWIHRKKRRQNCH